MKKWQEDNAVLKTAVVSKIEEKNKPVQDRYKNVFYLKNEDGQDDTLCIHWGRGCFDVGDTLTCKGRINQDGTMICWDYMVDKKAESV